MSGFFYKLYPYLIFFSCMISFMFELNYSFRKSLVAAMFATGAAFALVCAFENTMLSVALEVLELMKQKQTTKLLGA